MGSKNKIADKIIEQLPGGGCFYDLFFGGGAITHAAMLSGKWDKFVGNDVLGTVNLFKDCVAGRLTGAERWVGREDFKRLKDTDLYVKIFWSFGNNGKDYLYGRHIEPFKKAFYYAAVFNDYSMFESMGIILPHSDKKTPYERKIEIGRLIKENHEDVKEKYIKSVSAKTLQSLENLERLQNIERSGIPKGLQTDSIIAYTGDYRDVAINEPGVIYCDIPYYGKKRYGQSFDYDAFYNWCESQKLPVYISEEYMPEDRFICVWQTEKRRTLGDGNARVAVEKLWTIRK